MNKRTYFLGLIAATLFACAGCESTPEVKLDACECVPIVNNKLEDNPMYDSCLVHIDTDAEFKKIFLKCQYAEITGQDTSNVVIPENKAPEVILPNDGTYALDLAESSIRFLGKNSLVGKKHNGTIGFASGSLTVQDTLVSAAEFVLDMSSLASAGFDDEEEGNNFAGHLKSADFFDVENHPTATVKLVSVNDKVYKVKGEADVTIKGITKRLPIHFSVAPSNENRINIGGSLLLNRTDFGVNYGSGSLFDNLGDNVIDDEVPVVFDLEISK
jgi:polyisoprenoid-binding protein YceI